MSTPHLRLIITSSGAEFEPLQVKVDEAAKLLSMSRRQVDRLIAAGELPSIGRGRLRRIALADLRAWQTRNRERVN